MQRRWNADQALELIQRERITNAGGVPTIAWQIIEHPRFDEYDLSSLEIISYGGAPSAPELVRRMKERFPKLQPGQGWGMTETSATATSNVAEDYERKPVELRRAVADRRSAGSSAPTARTLPVGEVGELWYRGPDRRARLLEQAAGDGRDLRRRLGEDRRPRARRRGRLRLHRRPRQGHADPRRREHLLRRGRERALRPPGGDGRRGDRHPAPHARRRAGRGRASEARREGERARSCATSWRRSSPPSRCR